MFKLVKFVTYTALLVYLSSYWAVAKEISSSNSPILFSAETLTYNDKKNRVEALGNVEITQGKRILMADSVFYEEQRNLVTAEGNVTLLEPSGDVLFAKSMQLSGDLKEGVIRDLQIRFADNSRLAAKGATRKFGNETAINYAVYSPCNDCGNRRGKEPFWQIKAKKVVHDQKEKKIKYRDAKLEVLGVPVAYTPYFSHPDPTVKRKSGFLAPKFGGSSTLGSLISLPYFIDFGPNKDLTVTPTATSKERLQLSTEYRYLQNNSRLDNKIFVAYDSNDQFLGYVDSQYRRDVNDIWRAGVDIKRTSDDTYLRRYKINTSKSLNSRIFAEGFKGRDYAKIDSYFTQGLQETDKQGDIPIVLPMIDYNYQSEPESSGSTTKINFNALALTKTQNTDTRRLSLDSHWTYPTLSKSGQLIDFNLALRSDLYHITKARDPDSTPHGITGRLHPKAYANWSYPLTKVSSKVTQLLEPKASIIISPNGGNPSKIKNEDSIDFELDEINLFNTNRFAGLDRVEGGSRITYGLKWGAFGNGGGQSSISLGQSYRFRADDTFAKNSGLEDNFSDLVGSLNIFPGDHLNFNYRTRLSHEDLSPNRSEILLTVGPPSTKLTANYIFFDRQENSEFASREEFSGSIFTKWDRLWRSSFSTIYDLNDDGGVRSLAFDTAFECECFTFKTILKRDFFSDRELEPSDSIMLQLNFKTLGDVQAALF